MRVNSKKWLTFLHLEMSPLSNFKICRTTKPATIAFVVAIAGMMLPAIARKRKYIYINW